MSHFQHATATNSASLRSIFEARSTDWTIWSYSDDISIEIRYDLWGAWIVRSYICDDYGRQYTVVSVGAQSYSSLLRKIKTLKQSYTLLNMSEIDQFLIAKLGYFHIYDVDTEGRWVKDIN